MFTRYRIIKPDFFSDIRRQATARALTMNQDALYNQLDRGAKVLENNQQCDYYLHAMGLMHQAKLKRVLDEMPGFLQDVDHRPLNVVDYASGQAIGSLVLNDYLHNKGVSPSTSTFRLIEPSLAAISLGTTYLAQSFRYYDMKARVLSVNGYLDNLRHCDIETDDSAVKLHIFSNIFDIPSFDVIDLAKKIEATQKGKNYFLCAGPYFDKNKKNPKNARMIEFTGHYHSRSMIVNGSTGMFDVPYNTASSEKKASLFFIQFMVDFG